VLCDTCSFSSSRDVVVTVVRTRERHARPRGIARLRFAWRLFRATLRATPTKSPAAGTAPLANPAVACFGAGVRPLVLRDDWYELLQLLPESMRHTC
jgi:hypothetical protein